MKIGVFAQARLNSKRFPGKMLTMLSGPTLVEHCMKAARQIKGDVYCLLVPTEDVDTFYIYSNQQKWKIFGGSENDVLNRFKNAIELFNVDTIVRVTCDKPILAINYINKALKYAKDYDLITYEEEPLLSTTCAIMNAKKLLEADKNIIDTYCREHVKPALIALGCSHKILNTPERLKKFNYKFTIDTEKDYFSIREMFFDLYRGKPIELETAIKWFFKKNSSVN